ncbi:MAG TPA: DDE-type integrase/transposase/recombinase [Acidobacteriota bacterium]|jgi:IS1 family transposase
MNRLTSEQRAQVINCLIEGCSIRSTVRMTGIAKKTVMRLLVEAGKVAAAYQDKAFRGLTCKRLQVDELWAFCYCKQKNVTAEIVARNPNAGDVWLWVAIDAETKLVPCWLLSSRDAGAAADFMEDLAGRLAKRVQLTTDGHKPYLEAIESAFGSNIDYAMLIKLYGSDPESDTRYSPAKCIGCKGKRVTGNPDPDHVSTSIAERQNLSVRMTNRRYTRLTNAFSRKLQNHAAAVALNYFAYNFIKIHRTLRTTPAMAAGVTDRLWEVSDLVALLEAKEAERAA